MKVTGGSVRKGEKEREREGDISNETVLLPLH